MFDRGDEVTVVAFRGIRLKRRVWEDTGPGLLVCSEAEWERALRAGEEPLCSGFPKADVIVGPAPPEPSGGSTVRYAQ
jgi:hypothetical protein